MVADRLILVQEGQPEVFPGGDVSPFVQTTKVEKVEVELSRKVRYELDGGERTTVKHLKAKVEPKAITVRVREGG